MKAKSPKPTSAAALADRWSVSLRTIYTWIAAGVPAASDEGMAQ